MNSKQSSFFRMDEQVLYTMAGICLIAILVLAFRFAADKPCTDVNIGYGKDSIYVNDVVHFNANNKTGKEYAWDFGDSASSAELRSTVNHTYRKAKIYTIKVVVDDKCTDIQTLTVYERKPILTTSPEIVFVGIPESATVNDKIIFKGLSDGAQTYEWKLDGSPEIVSRAGSFSYSFKTMGNKKFELTVNKGKKGELTNFGYIDIQPKKDEQVNNKQRNDNKGGGRPIVINTNPVNPPISIPEPPKLEPPEPEKPIQKSPEKIITNGQLEAFLFEVYEGKKSYGDFAPYLCDKDNISVIFKNADITFSKLCEDLKRIKKITKIDAVVKKTNQNACIMIMQVKITRKTGPAGIFKTTE